MNAVEIRDLQFNYLGSNKQALKIPFFSIREEETVLITGKSGSGKSTLLQCINGIIPHIIKGTMEGEVNIFGKPVSELTVPELSRTIGTLLQDPERQIINYKVEEEIAFAPENFNLPREEIVRRIENSIEATGIESLRGRETSKLSGGEMQRVVLASVLAMDPKILILDEPTSNIDPEGTSEIFEFLNREKGKRTVVIVEHKVERVLPFVDRIVVVDHGQIVLDGRKEDLVRQAQKLFELGIEIPRHVILANLLGVSTLDAAEIGKLASERGLLPASRERSTEAPLAMAADVKASYYGGFSLDVSLSVMKGHITAIMGRNGAGKSTLLKAIIGFVEKSNGYSHSILDFGEKVLKNPDLQITGSLIGYLPQSFDLMLINKTVERELTYSMRVRKMKGLESIVSELKELFSLEEYLKTDPLTLSQGQRRRVAMAGALASGGRIILMDEPTSGQDYFHKENLGRELTELKNKGFSILMVTHDSRFVYRFADRIIVLDKGEKVLEGTPEEVFQRSEMYGVVPPSEFHLRYRHELPA